MKKKKKWKWPDFEFNNLNPNHLIIKNQDISQLNKKHKDVILRCHKYILKIPLELENKLHKWFNDYIDMYNITTYYLEPRIILNTKKKKFKVVDYETFRNEIKYIDVRTKLKPQMEEIRKRNHIHIDIIRGAIEHCCEMYKSAYRNHMRGNIKYFRIRKLKYNKSKKTITLSRMCFSKSKDETKEGILGYRDIQIYDTYREKEEIKLHYNHIIAECKLQYDDDKKKFYLFVPKIKPKKEIEPKFTHPLGIDIGVRTFTTCYGQDQNKNDIIIKCGQKSKQIITKYYKKLDDLHYKRNKNKLSKSKCKKSRKKYQNKLHNSIVDMHWKVSNLLCSNFNEIRVGRISTSSLVNKKRNKKSPPSTRRKLNTLNTYQFIQRLECKGEEYRTKVYRVSEYNTTKQCSKCGTLNHNVKDNDTYYCVSPSCSYVQDRDVNAAINISRRIPKYKY